MSADRPDSSDDIPTLRSLPPGGSGDEVLRDDYRDFRPLRPARRPGFGFWMAVGWAALYFVATQIVAAIVLGIPIFLIAILLESQKDGGGVANDPSKINEWMQGPSGGIATLCLVSGTQFAGLLLSWILLRYWCGREWKRKIALTRLPSLTHFVLVVIGFPALLALSTAVSEPIQRYIPSLQDILNSLGVNIQFEGAETMIGKLVGPSPWALALFAVAISPGICEEVFCRGFLGWGLGGRYRTWVAVLIVSFLFGCLHGDPQQGFGAMLLGAAIHGAYLATRSLLVAMLIHFANNGIAVVHLNKQLSPGVLDPFENVFKDSPYLFVATGLVLFVAVACALYQTRCRLVAGQPGLPTWEPDGISTVELPPPNSGTVVAHDPISSASVVLVAIGAVAFGLVMALA